MFGFFYYLETHRPHSSSNVSFLNIKSHTDHTDLQKHYLYCIMESHRPQTQNFRFLIKCLNSILKKWIFSQFIIYKQDWFSHLYFMQLYIAEATIFEKKNLPLKTWKKHPQKLLIIDPIFFSIANQPKTSLSIIFCSIKMCPCATST